MRLGRHQPAVDFGRHVEILVHGAAGELDFQRLAVFIVTHRPQAAASNQTFEQYLLRLTELEVVTRQSNALTTRIRQADFPVEKDLENFDVSAIATVNKQKVLELARCDWITQRSNVCLLGQPGTGKTHLAVTLGTSVAR